MVVNSLDMSDEIKTVREMAICRSTVSKSTMRLETVFFAHNFSEDGSMKSPKPAGRFYNCLLGLLRQKKKRPSGDVRKIKSRVNGRPWSKRSRRATWYSAYYESRERTVSSFT